MNEIIALYELANALKSLEMIESFSYDASGCTGMHLTWSQGSATPGYQELSRARSESIRGPMWREIRRMAIDEARARIEAARRKLAEAQGVASS